MIKEMLVTIPGLRRHSKALADRNLVFNNLDCNELNQAGLKAMRIKIGKFYASITGFISGSWVGSCSQQPM